MSSYRVSPKPIPASSLTQMPGETAEAFALRQNAQARAVQSWDISNQSAMEAAAKEKAYKEQIDRENASTIPVGRDSFMQQQQTSRRSEQEQALQKKYQAQLSSGNSGTVEQAALTNIEVQRARENSSYQQQLENEAYAADAPLFKEQAEFRAKMETFREVNDFKTKNMPYDTQTIAGNTEEEILEFMLSTNIISADAIGIEGGMFKFPEKKSTGEILPVAQPATIVTLEAKTNKIKMQTNKFILTSLTKTQQERFQIVETFGEPTVQFFDQRTKMYILQGILLDADFGGAVMDTGTVNAAGVSNDSEKIRASKQSIYNKKVARYQWAQAFQTFYTDHLRATELKKAGLIGAIYVNNSIIKGYPISLTIGKESTNMPDAVTFQMTWVIEKDILNKADDIRYMFDGGVTLNAEFKTALANLVSLIEKHKALKTNFSNATLLADAKTIRDEMDTVEINIKEAEKLLRALAAAKRGQFYEVDKNY